MWKQALLALSLVGCLDWAPSPNHHYDIYIDSSFSSDQAQAIVDAASEWQVATEGYFTFDVTLLDRGDETISIYADINSTQLNKDCDSHGGELGCQASDGVDSQIYMPLNGLDAVTFKQTATHEIGHALGANHIGPGNVMCADRGCAALTVQCGDVEEVAKEWNYSFDPSVLTICKQQCK